MAFDEVVRERGFRRWYERQLYESHAYLVTALLSAVMVALVVEDAMQDRSLGSLALLVAVTFAGGAVAIHGWVQFKRLLIRAESMASQATCPRCSAYARFTVVDSRPDSHSPVGCATRVRCRKCGCEWTLL